MRLDQALQHSREAGCEARRRGARLVWQRILPYSERVACWYAEEERWGRVEFNVDDILATDWQCSDGWQPDSAPVPGVLATGTSSVAAPSGAVGISPQEPAPLVDEARDLLEDIAVDTDVYLPQRLRARLRAALASPPTAGTEEVEQIAAWVDSLADAVWTRPVGQSASAKYIELRDAARGIRSGLWRYTKESG